MKKLGILFFAIAFAMQSFAQTRKCNIDTPSIISRVISPTGYGLDEQYLKQISQPSEYMGDFFGVQILKNRTKEQMIKELSPYSVTDSTLVLKFTSGTATLSYDSYMEVLGTRFDNNNILFEGDDFATFLAVKDEFYNYLKVNKLSRKYLIKNPYYKNEKIVAEQLKAASKRELQDFDRATFEASANSIVIYPDRVHGDIEAFKRFLAFVEITDFDWLAIEMLNQNMTEIANDYIFAKQDSKRFIRAKNEIETFYKTAWISHFEKRGEKYDKNPFIELFDLMRERGKAIYGMENSTMMSLLFRNGETPFGAAVRNVDWAASLPRKGRGVVFGGNLHFTDSRPVNFQDFIDSKEFKEIYYVEK